MLSIKNYISGIPSSKRISVVLLLIIILLVFSNSLFSEFVWDDQFILKKDIFTDWKNIGDIFLTADTAHTDDNISYYRPVTYLTFLFDYQVWELKPFWYSLENILLHASVVIIFYLLIARLLISRFFRHNRICSPASGATSPVCHPGWSGRWR